MLIQLDVLKAAHTHLIDRATLSIRLEHSTQLIAHSAPGLLIEFL